MTAAENERRPWLAAQKSLHRCGGIGRLIHTLDQTETGAATVRPSTRNHTQYLHNQNRELQYDYFRLTA